METGELRRRIMRELELGQREAQEQRAATDQARAAFTTFMDGIAAPLFKQAVTVLRAANHQFTSHTPADSVRLSSDRRAGDFVEIELDGSVRPPRILGRTSIDRGHRGVTVEEHPVGGGKAIDELTDEDVVEFLIPAIRKIVGTG